MRNLFVLALLCSSLSGVVACAEAAAPTEDEMSSTTVPTLKSSVEPLAARALPVPLVDLVDATVSAGSATNVAETTASLQSAPTLLEEEALQTDGETVDWTARGRALLLSDQPGEAVFAFRRALSADPSASVWSALGESYARAGQRAQAARCFEEALRTEANRSDARTALIGLYAHVDDERSRRHAERLVRQRPEDPVAHRQLGTAYVRLSMWAEAIASLERCLSLGGGSSQVHNLIGYSAMQLGHDELALNHLESMLELTPQHAYMLNNLGLAYERAGRPVDAFAAYLRALELRPKAMRATVNRDRVAAMLTDTDRDAALAILERLHTPPTLREGSATTSIVPADAISVALE